MHILGKNSQKIEWNKLAKKSHKPNIFGMFWKIELVKFAYRRGLPVVLFLDVQFFHCMRAKKTPNDATCQSWNFLEYAQFIYFQSVKNNFKQNCPSGKINNFLKSMKH